jgi:hypothetical protein
VFLASRLVWLVFYRFLEPRQGKEFERRLHGKAKIRKSGSNHMYELERKSIFFGIVEDALNQIGKETSV